MDDMFLVDDKVTVRNQEARQHLIDKGFDVVGIVICHYHTGLVKVLWPHEHLAYIYDSAELELV